MQSQKQQQDEILNLISFAIYEKRHHDVVNLIGVFLSQQRKNQPEETKKMYMSRAEAYSNLGKYKQSIDDCEQAIKLGASQMDVYHLKVRGYLENNEINEAQRLFQQIVDSNPQFKRILGFKRAIEVLKDQRQVFTLNQNEQKLFSQMKNWLYKAGGSYDKLKIANLGTGYRGAIATKTIHKKQPIVYIPKSEIITLEMAKKNPYCRNLINIHAPLLSPKHTFLSIFLLEESKLPNSRWRLYIDLLPTDHSCFPINFRNEQLSELIGSPFLFMIHQKVMDLKRDYDTVLKADRSFQKYTFREFCWARMMIGSRIFGLSITGIKTEVLVPFADMLNHKLPKQTVWNYVQGMNGFIIQSQQDIEIGQQVFDSYGRKCNSRFLLNYGFVIPNNKDNEITLKVCFNENDPFAQLKREMMKERPENQGCKLMKVSLSMTNNKFYELMGLLRFICVTEKQTLMVLAKISNIQSTQQAYRCIRTPPISLQNEITVWKKFGSMCQKALNEYSNSIEQDRQLLKNKKLISNMFNIITLRMGEKYILTEFICMSEQVVAILQSQNLVQIMLKQTDKLYYKYLYKILSLMPGIDKTVFTKMKEQETKEQVSDEEGDYDEEGQIN